MRIETRFNIGDKVQIKGSDIGEIEKISIEVKPSGTLIWYIVESPATRMKAKQAWPFKEQDLEAI